MKVEQEYELVPIESVVEHPDNPNRGDVDLIRESIERNSWYGALIVQRSTRRILAGNHRWQAAKLQGATEIPVIWKDLDEPAALRVLLVDNESARRGEIDVEVRDQILARLATLDGDELAGSGFDLSQLESSADDEDDEFDDEEEEEPGLFDPEDLGPAPDKVWGVIIMVPGEAEQEELYNQMVQDFGSTNVRVVSV
jgi:ParB-like chromosome segregation protein Spo0J